MIQYCSGFVEYPDLLSSKKESYLCFKALKRAFFILWLFLVIVIFLLQEASGADVTLEWKPNSEPDLAGYRAFARKEGASYNYNSPNWSGTKNTCTLSNIENNSIYYFVVRAFDNDGFESGNSNEVCYVPQANSPPVAYPGSSQTYINQPVYVTLSADDPDGDSLSYIITLDPAHGFLTGVPPSFIYTPDAGYTGTDNFSFLANDGALDSNEESVTITIIDDGSAGGPDSDDDGLSDYDEEQYGTDKDASDTDRDNIDDRTEVFYWAEKWNDDVDGDGVINLLDPDADGDGALDGDEINGGFDPADFDSFPEINFAMEVDEIDIDSRGWASIKFEKYYSDPVLVVGPLSLNENEMALPSIKNIDGSGFEAIVSEADTTDGDHAFETAGYIVMNRGVYNVVDTVNGNVFIEANNYNISAQDCFVEVPFEADFNEVPIVLVSVISGGHYDRYQLRIKDISEYSFYIKVMGGTNPVTEYRVSYIAWEPSSGVIGGIMRYRVGTSEEVVNNFQTIEYKDDFDTTPFLLAAVQTSSDEDSAVVRWINKDFYAVDIMIEAPSSSSGTIETAGYVLISSIDRGGNNPGGGSGSGGGGGCGYVDDAGSNDNPPFFMILFPLLLILFLKSRRKLFAELALKDVISF